MCIKNIIIFSFIIFCLGSFLPAKAEDFKKGCYPKNKLGVFMKENRQGQIDQYFSQKRNRKTTITAEHDGTGYVQKGDGYWIESDDNQACVIAFLRVDNKPAEKQILLEPVYRLADMKLTFAEWQHVSKYTNSKQEKIKADWAKDGMSADEIETGLKALSIMGNSPPDKVEGKFLYQIGEDRKITALERAEVD